MKKSILNLVGISLLFSCSSKSTSNTGGEGDTRTEQVKMLDLQTYLLTKLSSDKSYAFTSENPVKVGGVKTEGASNEYRYLNALLGPNGEKVKYFRYGSCCGFKTPNGMINDMGLLDRYGVCYEGSKDTVSIYINMYDEGNLYIPVGFTAKK